MASHSLAQSFFDVSPPAPEQPPERCEICDIVEQQVAQGCNVSQGAPFADVYAFRNPGTVTFEDAVMQRFALARASRDPETAERLLASDLESANADIRYMAATSLLMVRASAGQPLTERNASSLFKIVELAQQAGASMPGSDAAFLQALRARANGDARLARDHVDRALQLEPRFFSALALRLDLVFDRALLFGQQSRAVCEATYLDVLQTLTAILDLSPCRYQAAHLDLYLSRRFTVPDDVALINLSRVYLAKLANRPEAARMALTRFENDDRVLCRAQFLPDLQRLVQVPPGPEQ